jgi:hypothetical protein
MTKRPTVGRSFFEFAKFLKEILRKIDLVFVPLRVEVGRVLDLTGTSMRLLVTLSVCLLSAAAGYVTARAGRSLIPAATAERQRSNASDSNCAG